MKPRDILDEALTLAAGEALTLRFETSTETVRWLRRLSATMSVEARRIGAISDPEDPDFGTEHRWGAVAVSKRSSFEIRVTLPDAPLVTRGSEENPHA